MSIYLGDQKIGVAVPVDPFELPEDKWWQRKEIKEWVRPLDWPNLDDIEIPNDFEGVYLTYDNHSNLDYRWAAFYCTTNGDYNIAIGHIENGTWVQDSTQTAGNEVYVEINYGALNLDYDYLVFKLTPTTNSIHFTRFGFARVTQETLGTYALRQPYDQYCLERRGILPYITNTGYSADNYLYCTGWMEYDNTSIGTKNTGNMNFRYAFFNAFNLKKINFDNWPTEQWTVTRLDNMFQNCYTIQELDLNNWDTSKWKITNISSMFDNCRSLKKLKIENWDLSNWGSGSTKTLSLATLFNYCFNLEELDLSKWNVSNIRVTSLASTWYNCYKLRKLKVGNWNTSNWRVTTMASTFTNCYKLIDIDFSNWDVSDWSLTTLANCWQNNYNLTSLKGIENWDTTNWAITTLLNTWSGCYKLNTLDLSKWNVSNWRVTTLQATWQNCYNLKTLKFGNWTTSIDGWDTSLWSVIDLRSTFYQCFALQNFDIFKLNCSNWPISRISQMFYCCYFLKEADIKTWSNNTTWIITSDMGFNYVFSYCYNLKKVDVSNIDVQNVTLTNYGSNKTYYTPFYSCYSLEELKLPKNYKGHINLRYSYHLTRSALLDIFNQLETALTDANIVLTEMRYKLTNADIAIATAKGYTVT